MFQKGRDYKVLRGAGAWKRPSAIFPTIAQSDFRAVSMLKWSSHSIGTQSQSAPTLAWRELTLKSFCSLFLRQRGSWTREEVQEAPALSASQPGWWDPLWVAARENKARLGPPHGKPEPMHDRSFTHTKLSLSLNISWLYWTTYLRDFSISRVELNFVLNRLSVLPLYKCAIIYLNRFLLTFRLFHWRGDFYPVGNMQPLKFCCFLG